MAQKLSDLLKPLVKTDTTPSDLLVCVPAEWPHLTPAEFGQCEFCRRSIVWSQGQPRELRKVCFQCVLVRYGTGITIAVTEKTLDDVARFEDDVERKRFFSIAHEHGWKDDEVRAWLERQGYEKGSTQGIKKADYDALCASLSAGVGSDPALDGEELFPAGEESEG